jgi:hypothetical protein
MVVESCRIIKQLIEEYVNLLCLNRAIRWHNVFLQYLVQYLFVRSKCVAIRKRWRYTSHS